MPPAAPRGVLLGGVLGILDQQVDPTHELDQAPIATVDVAAPQAILHDPVRLMVGDVGDRNSVSLEAVAHAYCRVVQVVRAHDSVLDLDLAFLELAEADVGAQVAQWHGKVGVMHLPSEHIAQRTIQIARAVDGKAITWRKHGREERKT